MARATAPAPAMLVAATAASVALLLSPLPVKQAFAARVGPILFFPATRAVTFLESMLTLRSEIRALRLELARRHFDEAQLHALMEQNRRLRAMVDLRGELPFGLVPGMVSSRPGRFLGEYLAVDVGSDHGATVGSGVVSIDGLVGRVVEVRRTRALVRTLLSPESRVSVHAPRTGAGGILRPERTVGFVVPDIPMAEGVGPGDTLLTSGLGGVFPAGLRIGIVSSVREDRRLQLLRASVRPFVRFDAIREVFIIRTQSADTSWMRDERIPD